jgi:hypothetical protein
MCYYIITVKNNNKTLEGGKEMKTGRLIMTSDDDFCKMVNVPDEVLTYFEKLSKEYEWNEFVIYNGEIACTQGIKPDIEIEIYDDFRE